MSVEMKMFASAVGLAALWGLVCGSFERLLLAPRRRLSSVGPAYLPAMFLALLAGAFVATDKDRPGFLYALLMAAIYFFAGAAPALATFHLSRRILRTRFSGQNKTEAGSLEP